MTWYAFHIAGGPIMLKTDESLSALLDYVRKWYEQHSYDGCKVCVTEDITGNSMGVGALLFTRTLDGLHTLSPTGETSNIRVNWEACDRVAIERRKLERLSAAARMVERCRWECFNAAERTQVYARFTHLSLARFYQRKDSPLDKNGKLCAIRWADPEQAVGTLVYNPANKDKYYLTLKNWGHLPEYHWGGRLHDTVEEAREDARRILSRPHIYGSRGDMDVWHQAPDRPPTRYCTMLEKDNPPIKPRRGLKRSVT